MPNDNRLFVDVVLWIARTGAPWRDLPSSARSRSNASKSGERQCGVVGRFFEGHSAGVMGYNDFVRSEVEFENEFGPDDD